MSSRLLPILGVATIGTIAACSSSGTPSLNRPQLASEESSRSIAESDAAKAPQSIDGVHHGQPLSESAIANAGKSFPTRKLTARPQINANGPFHLGVELATMGQVFPNHTYTDSYNAYFSPSVMNDIANNLHLNYVRSGFIPQFMRDNEGGGFGREDDFMKDACNAGLGVMVIVPTPSTDYELGSTSAEVSDSVSVTKAFFSRYHSMLPNCQIEAEVENEPDIVYTNPPATTTRTYTSADLAAYVSYYGQVEPYIQSLGYYVITGGTSGLDTNWTSQLRNALVSANLGASFYGYHPYVGVSGSNPNANSASIIQNEINTMGNASGGIGIAVTEFGSNSTSNKATDLHDTIINASKGYPPAYSTTWFTVYTYADSLTGDSPSYGLKNNSSLYSAVQQAAVTVQNTSPPGPTAAPDPTPTATRNVCKTACP